MLARLKERRTRTAAERESLATLRSHMHREPTAATGGLGPSASAVPTISASIQNIIPQGATSSPAQRHGERVDDLVRALDAIPFLPLRRNLNEDGRSPADRFMFVPDRALPDDEDVIRRAAALQIDERIQAVLASKWEAMLAHLQDELTVRARSAPPKGVTADLLDPDPRFRAALAVGSLDDQVSETIRNARAYWRDREIPPPRAPEPQPTQRETDLKGVGRNTGPVDDDEGWIARQQAYLDGGRGRR